MEFPCRHCWLVDNLRTKSRSLSATGTRPDRQTNVCFSPKIFLNTLLRQDLLMHTDHRPTKICGNFCSSSPQAIHVYSNSSKLLLKRMSRCLCRKLPPSADVGTASPVTDGDLPVAHGSSLRSRLIACGTPAMAIILPPPRCRLALLIGQSAISPASGGSILRHTL